MRGVTALPYGYMATLIVLFTAVTSFALSAAMPFSLGSFALLLALLKASLVALWLWAAWRVKDRREKAYLAKEELGDLWTGPIDERALGIPLEDLEVIRYHLDADEVVKAVFRRHKITLWKAIMWLNIMFWSLLASLWLATNLPALEWRPEDIVLSEDTVTTRELGFRFVWWWLPLLVTTLAFYEALKHWQIRKWTIRIITNKNLYLFREQPTYMPWVPPKFKAIPVYQVVGMDSDVGSFGGMVGWTNIYLQVRADEHDDEPEPVVIDYVTDGIGIVNVLKRTLPMFESRHQPAQPVLLATEEPGDEAEEPLELEAPEPEPELEDQGDPHPSAQDQLS
jgi:hypothetical protein